MLITAPRAEAADEAMEPESTPQLAPAPELVRDGGQESPAVVMLSGKKFLLGCAAIAAVILFVGRTTPMRLWLLGAEVMATILALFLLGSFKYQVHKNPLTYGMVMIVLATFIRLRTSLWHVEVSQD